MKFIIDRPIKNSYSKDVVYEETNDYSWMKDKEKMEKNKNHWIEPCSYVVNGWIDEAGLCHRMYKEVKEFIDVNTLEELYAIAKENEGKIVFGTHRGAEGVDGWIEIYDDYRE